MFLWLGYKTAKVYDDKTRKEPTELGKEKYRYEEERDNETH